MILLILFLVIDDSNEEADRTKTENETRKLIQKIWLSVYNKYIDYIFISNFIHQAIWMLILRNPIYLTRQHVQPSAQDQGIT